MKWDINRHTITTKLRYRKDDRVMRHIITWAPWKFSRVPSIPTATFPKIFNGTLFRSILWTGVQNLKFVALPLPQIIAGTKKIWAVPGHAHAPFYFNGLLFRSILWMGVQNLKFEALPVPEIIGVLQKFGQSLDTPTLTFLHYFNGILFWPNLKSVALPVPEIIAIRVLGGGCKPWILENMRS